MSISLRSATECRFDQVSLGEVMLRLDPGEGRIRSARSFQVWEGGGEYNVARGLRRCFGLRTGLVSAFVDNEIGRLLEDCMLRGGVDLSYVRWVPFDGIGQAARNGLNFTERGFGIRGAVGCSDRAATAASQLRPGQINWNQLFGDDGVRWFHTGGIFAALSDSTPEVVIEAVRTAKQFGTIVSYDLNYRPSLWNRIGGKQKAQAVNREIAKYVDVMLGNEEDFTACLGIEVDGVDAQLREIDVDGFQRMIERVVQQYPNFSAVATTLRGVHTATVNDWSAIAWYDGQFFHSRAYPNLEILDRVGGGDSFASGFIYGVMQHGDGQAAVDFGTAHGALAMTTPGDTSMASRAEVEQIVRGGSARVVR